MDKPRLEIRRGDDDTCTVIGYLRADAIYAVVKIADGADAETIAAQLQCSQNR